jgi:hypothetical protein
MPAAAAWFKVATERLLEQGRLSLGLLRDPEGAPRRAELAVVGLEGARFTFALEDALAGLETARADQLRLSEALEDEREQDRILADEGFRWLQRLHARGRYAAAGGADPGGELPARLGYRSLPRARGAGVEAELLRVLPEVEALLPRLLPHGVDQAFLDEGQQLGRGLARARQRTADVQARRKEATAAVRAGEEALSTLLRRLVAADEAASLDLPGRPISFPLRLLAPPRKGGLRAEG